MLRESRKHPAHELLRQIPRLGPIRVALLIALVQTPHRFRTKRQLWAYCGLALQTRSSGEYRFTAGQLQHSKNEVADKLVFVLVSLESMLLKDSNEPITKNIGERMAFLIGQSMDERKAIIQNVDVAYRILCLP